MDFASLPWKLPGLFLQAIYRKTSQESPPGLGSQTCPWISRGMGNGKAVCHGIGGRETGIFGYPNSSVSNLAKYGAAV